MARYIHCPSCKNSIQKKALRFGEYYEAIGGETIKDMLCDACPALLPKGSEAFAACLFPSESHFNFARHHPANWMDEYIRT